MFKPKIWHNVIIYKLLILLTKSGYVKVERTNTWELCKLRLSNKENFEQFYNLAKSILDDNTTLLGYDRLFIIWQAINYVVNNARDYAIVEMGVYKGGSSLFIAKSFEILAGSKITMYSGDTFTGHPSNLTIYDTFHVKGGFGDVNYQDVVKYLSQCSNINILKGELSQTIKTIPETKFGFVHIDVDTYLATLKCLNYFGKRMVKNGVILLDDFNSPTCLGVKKAVNEYLATVGNKFYVGGGLHTKQLLLFKK